MDGVSMERASQRIITLFPSFAFGRQQQSPCANLRLLLPCLLRYPALGDLEHAHLVSRPLSLLGVSDRDPAPKTNHPPTPYEQTLKALTCLVNCTT